MRSEIVTITSFSHTGHGISENGWYILGAFPGDVVNAKVYKEAEGNIYAEIIQIVTPSTHRTFTPREAPFFDANAPWRYLDDQYENKAKKEIVKNIFKTVTGVNLSHKIASRARNNKLLNSHYRNKAAYSFMRSKGKLAFALYTRGTSGYEKVVQGDNLLVHPMINQTGKKFLEFFNQKNIAVETLKYLILRYSYLTSTVVAHILVTETNRKKLPFKKSDLEKFVNHNPSLQGVLVSHSPSAVRSSQTTKDFYDLGDITIAEKILEKVYRYHPSQFFQIYPDAFSLILKDCEKIISDIENHRTYELLDLYAGVGVIGLHLAQLVKIVHGVEYSPLAGEYALKNSNINNIHDFKFTEADVEMALEYIQSEQILIVDPPRSGLGKKLIEKVIKIKPEHIIYISCNPETQAYDYKKIMNHYDIITTKAYNLFPKTPHIEHIVHLQRKK